MTIKVRPVSDFLNQRSSLQHLLTEIRHQQQLLQLIQQKLPAKVAKHCYSVVTRGAQVHVLVDSPVWSNQLRFEIPQLLSQLRQQAPSIGSIKVRTVPQRSAKIGPTPSRQAFRSRHCSAGTVTHLRTCADYIEESALKNALNNLAKTLQSRCNSQLK